MARRRPTASTAAWWHFVAAGIVAALILAIPALTLAYAFDFGCSGSDTAPPPSPSSLRGRICDAEWAQNVLVAAPVVAALLGGAVSARLASWRPLVVAVVVALAALAFGFGSGVEGARD